MPLNEWYYVKMYTWWHRTSRKYPFIDIKATEISKRCVYVLVTWPWRLPEEWPEACSTLTVVGAGIMHGFGTDPLRQSDWRKVGIRSLICLSWWKVYHIYVTDRAFVVAKEVFHHTHGNILTLWEWLDGEKRFFLFKFNYINHFCIQRQILITYKWVLLTLAVFSPNVN